MKVYNKKGVFITRAERAKTKAIKTYIRDIVIVAIIMYPLEAILLELFKY